MSMIEALHNPVYLGNLIHKNVENFFARTIIIDELPFRYVEHEGFLNFCHVMQPLFQNKGNLQGGALKDGKLGAGGMR